jgi:hypothetical protein
MAGARVVIDELRELIVRAAPDEAQATPVRDCRSDEPLDKIMPFSSVIVLGTVIAIEDHYGITVRHADLVRALDGGVTLDRLAALIDELRNR